MELGRIGVWTGQAHAIDPAAVADLAAEVEALGYRALWIPGRLGGDVLDRCESALGGTSTLVVATGIVNVWRQEAGDVAPVAIRLNQQHQGRFLLGLGVSHQPAIGDSYVAPLKKMSDYLDQLDAAGQPAGDRVLAALRRRMLELARDRSAGSHPYFVPP
jgi:probable F420-dependent oxidoreductase